MSDYLSDLVSRSIGAANIIQPRWAARFETVQTTGALEAQTEPTHQSENFEEERLIETIQLARTHRRREPRLSERDKANSSQNDLNELIEEALLVSPRKTPSPESGQNEARVTAAQKAIERTVEPTSQNFSIQNPPSTGIQTPLTPQSRLNIAEQQEKSNGNIKHTPIPEKSVALSETANVEEPPRKKDERESLNAQAQVIIEPRVEKAGNLVEELSKQFLEGAKKPETPVINVTIGRVEVRAVAPSAAPKQTHAKPPTLSLDEYLRRRSKGGER